jgi:Zn-dependent protease with chaperone function
MLGSSDFLHVFALWIAIPLAFVPAFLNWWWSRSLRTGDAATLAERHLSMAQRVSAAVIMCSIVIGVTAGWMALGIVPLEWLTLSWSTHQVRRALLGETWPFHHYLLWRLRLVTGVWGFWWFLAIVPAVLAGLETPSVWWVAAFATIVALVWHHYYSRILLTVFDASPLSRPDLDGPFEDILGRARIAPPQLWRAGEERAVFANALAIPSVRGNNVLFFPTLLERLSTTEIAGVLAHEVAHLEHYAPRIHRLYATGAALVVALMGAGIAAAVYAPGSAWWIGLASIFAVFAGLTLRARGMQPKETEADLRAIELSRDPEALISGLIRLHAINHVPRRWSAQFEEQASHPSLARRIRAIRAQVDAWPRRTDALASAPHSSTAIERIVIGSPERGRAVFVEAERLAFLWCDGDITQIEGDLLQRARRAEMLAYADLRELRLVPAWGGTTVRAVNHQGRRWSMRIHDHDAARLQDALDRIDHLIVAQPRAVARIGGRLTAATVVLMASIVSGSLVTVLPVLLALRHPSRPILTGIAATLTAAALLTANEASVSWINMIMLAILAGSALWTARRQETTPDHQHVAWFWVERAVLAIPIVVGLTLIAVHAHDLYDLHTAVRERGWFAASTMGLAGFLATSGDRRSRRIGAGAVLIAAAAIWIASPWFLLGVVRDPLAVGMPVLTADHIPLTMTERRDVEGTFGSIWLAPEGDAVLLAADEGDEDDSSDEPRPRRFAVSGTDGGSRAFRASAAALVDHERVLVLDRQPGHSRLHADALQTGQSLWTLTLPTGDVTVIQAAADGRWRALAEDGHRFTRLDGRIGTNEARETSWTMPVGPDVYFDVPRLDEGPVALGVAASWRRPSLSWLGVSWPYKTTLLRAGRGETRPIASSRLTVDCAAPPLGVDGFVCVSFDGRWSRLWRVDAASSTFSPIGQVRRGFWRVRQEHASLIEAHMAYGAAVIELGSGTMRTFAPAWDGCGMDDFSIAREIVGVSCVEGGTTRVTFYQVERARPIPHRDERRVAKD